MTEEDVINHLPNLLHLIDFTDTPEIYQLDAVLKMNNISADELYLNLSINCWDLLVECRLNNIKHECFNLFKTIRTTEGYCCSFNYFGTASQYYLKYTPNLLALVSTNIIFNQSILQEIKHNAINANPNDVEREKHRFDRDRADKARRLRNFDGIAWNQGKRVF